MKDSSPWGGADTTRRAALTVLGSPGDAVKLQGCPGTFHQVVSQHTWDREGLGAESRCHWTRAFPAHTLMSRAEVGRGESPRPLTPWTRQVSGAGLASPMSPGPRQGQAQNPGPEDRCALQGLPSAGWGLGTADLTSDPEGLAVPTGAQGPGNVDTDVSRVLLAQHIENRALH